MLTGKVKRYIRPINNIYELRKEFINIDKSQKWLVNQLTDNLKTVNKYDCQIVINDSTKRILVRR